jgi:hypothetical protein
MRLAICFHGGMPTLVVGMCDSAGISFMPTASVGMPPIRNIRTLKEVE